MINLLTSFNSQRAQDARHLVRSLRRLHSDIPVHCFTDVGPEQWSWFADRGCTQHDVEQIESIRNVREAFGAQAGNAAHRWWTVATPWMIAQIPSPCLYIQPDCVILRPIEAEASAVLTEGPLITSAHPGLLNHRDLYKLMKIPLSLAWLTVQSGVVGLDLSRQKDSELLQQWQHAVLRMCIDKKVRGKMRAFEQGALLWAVHKCRLADQVFHDYRWNCPRALYGNERTRYRTGPDLYDRIAKAYPNINIIHFADQPKLSRLLFDPRGRIAIGA